MSVEEQGSASEQEGREDVVNLEELEEQDDQEVDTPFAPETAPEDEGLPFDLYVPLAVLLGKKPWDQLSPINSTAESSSEITEVVLPASTCAQLLLILGRVKRVMKMDPDVNVISKQAVNIVTKATVGFRCHIES